MKMPRSVVDNRRLEILKRIQLKDEIKVDELAEEFGLSLMTVRRDLQHLEDRHLITRFYGGATACLTSEKDSPEDEMKMYRRCISQYATRFVANDDVLFINGSSTALDMLRYIKHCHLQVYTNNGQAVFEDYPPNINLILTGGNVRQQVMVGEYAMRNLLNATANKTFIGCAAITENGEFCYNIPTEIGINEAMISRTTGELYILADHTKLMESNLQLNRYGSCMYDRSWTLITDELADPKFVEKLRNLGKQVHVVGLHDIVI